jgi:hypothetical protein
VGGGYRGSGAVALRLVASIADPIYLTGTHSFAPQSEASNMTLLSILMCGVAFVMLSKTRA